MVSELLDPLVDHLLILVEKHLLAEVKGVSVQGEAEHTILVLNLLEVKTPQKYNMFRTLISLALELIQTAVLHNVVP